MRSCCMNLVLLIALWSRASQGAPLVDPGVAKVIERYIAAIGGTNALQSHKSRQWSGIFELRSQGLSGQFEHLAARPNKQVTLVDLPLYGRMVTGFDGETGWMLEPGLRFRVITGSELARLKDDSVFLKELYESDALRIIKDDGRVVWNGLNCHRLRLVYHSGQERIDFFDLATGLLVKSDEDGGSWTFEDFKAVNGVRMPFARVFKRNQVVEQKILIDKVRFDEVEESAFQSHRYQPKSPRRALHARKNTPGANDAVDELVLKHMDENSVPGLSLAIVQKGRITKNAGYGFANLEDKTPVLLGTPFALASVSKVFTATGIMLLAEKGKLSIDERVSEFFKDAPTEWKKMTIRHLLNHSSGLPQEAYGWFSLRSHDPESMLSAIIGTPLQNAPGDRATYSNPGYHLLGMIISQRAGIDWAEFLRANVLLPKSMPDTRLPASACAEAGAAKGYVLSFDGELVVSNFPATRIGGAAGGWQSTATDVARWVIALERREMVSSQSLKQMERPMQLKDGSYSQCGLGWFVETIDGHRVLGHGGNSGTGFKSQLSRFVNEGISVIVLSNGSECDPKTLVQEISKHLPLKARAGN